MNLLDIPARNIWFLQEGLQNCVGLASVVTRILASNARILGECGERKVRSEFLGSQT